MPQFRKQTLTTVLFGDPEIDSPTTVKSSYFIPIHVHDHGTLTGLFDDDHPQYLTDSRAADLFVALASQITDRTVGLNVGGGIGVYLRKDGVCLEFKTLVSGQGITITEDTVNHTIIISKDVGVNGGTY